MNKKKIIALSIISVLLVICMIISISYGYYIISANKKLEIDATATTPACVGLTISKSQTFTLEPNYAVPISYEQFLNSSETTQKNFKYSFTVNNDCEEEKNLFVGFVNLTESSKLVSSLSYVLIESGDELSTTSAKKISDGSEGNIANVSDEIQQYLKNTFSISSPITYKMQDVTIGPKESKNYDLYVWIDEDAGNEVMNETLNATVILYNEIIS